MTAMREPSRDERALVERLEHAHENSVQRINGSDIFGEAAAAITSLSQEVADLKEVLADKRRLAREIDVAMHGEEGAAKQPSLCDLVQPAKLLRQRAESAERRLEEVRAETYESAVNVIDSFGGNGAFARQHLSELAERYRASAIRSKSGASDV